MRRPVVGVIGNAYRVENRFQTQMVGERNLRAVTDVAGALPLMFAGSPEITDIGALLDVVDGVVLTGARANVHPTRFKTEPHERHEPYDIHRDDVALALTEACVARGVPIFGICRGLQEMNVAFGGSLHPEIREIPGRMNHRMPRLENGEIHPDPTVVFADRHDVHLTRGCTGRVSSNPACASSSRASPKTAPSKQSGSRTRKASRSACSGTRNTTRSAIRSIGSCFWPLAKR